MNSLSAKYTVSREITRISQKSRISWANYHRHEIDLYLQTGQNTQLPHYLLDSDSKISSTMQQNSLTNTDSSVNI